MHADAAKELNAKGATESANAHTVAQVAHENAARAHTEAAQGGSGAEAALLSAAANEQTKSARKTARDYDN